MTTCWLTGVVDAFWTAEMGAEKKRTRKRLSDPIGMGVVLVIAGPHAGRIGDYDDDDEDGRGRHVAVVYFGPSLAVAPKTVRPTCLRSANVNDLRTRAEELRMILFPGPKIEGLRSLRREDALAELLLVEQTMNDVYAEAMLASMRRDSPAVFLSHSSQNKSFVQSLAVDLQNHGITPWLDEWRIEVGDSIPKGVAGGLEACPYIIVVLSKAAVSSKWVEREWHDKYWDELSSRAISVLPILLEDCEIPRLLRTKKFADFRTDYSTGLQQLLRALVLGPRPA